MTSTYWIFFVAYFAVLIGIAVFRARHMDDMSDYVLGRRKIGALTSAISAGSSATSAGPQLAFPALAFAAGMMHMWTVAFVTLGSWLSWTIMACRLRRYTMATDNSLTLPEFQEPRRLGIQVVQHAHPVLLCFGRHRSVLLASDHFP